MAAGCEFFFSFFFFFHNYAISSQNNNLDPNIGRKSGSWTMIQLAVSASWLYHSVHDEYPISTVNLLSHARAAFKYPAGPVE